MQSTTICKAAKKFDDEQQVLLAKKAKKTKYGKGQKTKTKRAGGARKKRQAPKMSFIGGYCKK